MLVILGVGVICYFVFSMEIAAQMYINYRGNPPNIICSQLYKTYTEKGVKEMAGLEYTYMLQLDTGVGDLTDKISTTGALPCFCLK